MNAADMLRTVLAELPPTTPGETATARRIEGAALALDSCCPAEFRCICDPNDLFDPSSPIPRAVEGCPAHRARRVAQQFIEQTDVQ